MLTVDEQETVDDSDFLKRKKTLLAWKAIMSLEPFVTLYLLKNTVVKGTIVGITDHETMIAVKDLDTPLGIIPNAKVRISDVEYLEFSINQVHKNILKVNCDNTCH
jgi:hypothetical protein